MKVKKLINFRVDRYSEMERRLEALAAKGLILEACGPYLWTFAKGAPQKLRYTVTYFAEGSIFNAEMPESQQTYIEYAEAAGWHFVSQYNQMQIFCTDTQNPVPFETDEGEKLANIRRCMRKSFIPSSLLIIIVFTLNLMISFSRLRSDPIDFWSNSSSLLSVAALSLAVFYSIYSLLDYAIWCKRSTATIAQGGTCVERNGRAARAFDILFLCVVFGCLGLMLLDLLWQNNWVMLFFLLLQMPMLSLIFWGSIRLLRRMKASAWANRIVSGIVLTLAAFGYMAVMVMLILRFGLADGREYRTVLWQVTPTSTHEYKLYNDYLPLTCEDLYGPTDYEYYSREATADSTPFLTKRSYRQDSLPAKDAPPWLEYTVITPHLDFVGRQAREQLLTLPPWREDARFVPIDDRLFGTVEAYQLHLDGTPLGDYLLFYPDCMVELNLQNPLTTAQAATVQAKLVGVDSLY